MICCHEERTCLHLAHRYCFTHLRGQMPDHLCLLARCAVVLCVPDCPPPLLSSPSSPPPPHPLNLPFPSPPPTPLNPPHPPVCLSTRFPYYPHAKFALLAWLLMDQCRVGGCLSSMAAAAWGRRCTVVTQLTNPHPSHMSHQGVPLADWPLLPLSTTLGCLGAKYTFSFLETLTPVSLPLLPWLPPLRPPLPPFAPTGRCAAV
jgi:hypothetical protein